MKAPYFLKPMFSYTVLWVYKLTLIWIFLGHVQNFTSRILPDIPGELLGSLQAGFTGQPGDSKNTCFHVSRGRRHEAAGF